MRFIYLILICFAAPVAAFVAWLRGVGNASRRERMADRFGRPRVAATAPVLWVHAASMGEVQAGAILVRRLLTVYPRHQIVMTTMTTTGAARVKALFTERVTHCYLPYDLPFAVRGFLTRINPEAALIMETELWPNLLRECHDRKIPVIIASARISSRTAHRYQRFASLFHDVLRETHVAAQSSADAERFKSLGATHVRVTGNIKFDIEVSETVRAAGADLRSALGPRFVWVAGSTHEGEERAVLEAHRKLLESRPDGLLVVVPRHPQRFDAVRSELTRSGVSFVARSSGAKLTKDHAVLLVDAMGELQNFYAAANAAFVGGSLVPVGGHNLLEPASLGKPTLCGPYLSNAQEIADLLIEAGTVTCIRSPQALATRLIEIALDESVAREASESAARVIWENRGAIDRVMESVTQLHFKAQS